jgi:hypothetical protein
MSVVLCGALPAAAKNSAPNLPANAASLLAAIHADAYKAENTAERLNTLDYQSDLEDLEWEGHSTLLSREADWGNDMDRLLVRLHTMENQLPPSQQSEINQVTPALAELNSTTNSAILFLNNHEYDLFRPQYREYLKEMEITADRVEVASSH